MFAFKFDKALEAAAYVLHRESCHQMNYMRLVKMLYIADRESVRQFGRPITGDRMVAMPKGPVLSCVLNLIKGQHVRSPEWEQFIVRDQFNVRLAADPGRGRLSRGEIETLERVAEENRSRDEWDMVEYTHAFPEWSKNNPGTSMKTIPFADLLEAVGRSADAKAIEEDARADRAAHRLLRT